jgi:sucrose synthase
MIRILEAFLAAHRRDAYALFRRYLDLGKPVLLRSEILREHEAFRRRRSGVDPIAPLIDAVQQATIGGADLYLAVRARVAGWSYLHVNVESGHCRQANASEYLKFQERIIGQDPVDGAWPLEIDLSPFERGFPRMREARSIGRGVEFLNRHLSSLLFDRHGTGAGQLTRFLKLHQCDGRQLMINDLIADQEVLATRLREAAALLETMPPGAEWAAAEASLSRLGFERGWGRTAARALETMGLLTDILEAPSPENLERFLGRIPMIFSIVILTPHGYFGQSGVLGKPDTGGQVVYILDQVRALEREMHRSLGEQGLDIEPRILVLTRLIPEAEGTTCNIAEEPVAGTRHARILRIPFRDTDGSVVGPWISRFCIWPYLERFAADAEQVIRAELGGRPDLVIGNYSDGNLVASLLAPRLGTTQCNIAHALEKSKYALSDLYWRDHEQDHHFSCQYTADLIAMNTADFIITSTYQEIAGTSRVVGQYESYGSYTLPGLYRVLQGIDPFDPKFNIVSPGADPDVFFPYSEHARRLESVQPHLDALVRGGARADTRGVLAAPGRPLLFAMSRLDRIKNVTGLLDLYGRSDDLRGEADLLVATGTLDPATSHDDDEKREIARMHELMDAYELDSQVRWVELRSDKAGVGELYRYVADSRGAFVQPAVFEAFGLTVIEAMASGLPTFATLHGGPLEIIEHGRSGFHIDPERPEAAAALMAAFLRDCRGDPARWTEISEGAVARVESRYTWKLYADRLLTLSRIYGFWKYITNIEREETRRYLEMFYTLVYRPLAAAVPRPGTEGTGGADRGTRTDPAARLAAVRPAG